MAMAVMAGAATAVACSSLEMRSFETSLVASSCCKQLLSFGKPGRVPTKPTFSRQKLMFAKRAATAAATTEVSSMDWKEQAASIASTLDNEGVEQAAELILSFKGSAPLSPVFIGGVIKRSKDSGAALELFNWARRQKGFKHDEYSYNCVMVALLTDKKSVAMQELFTQMEVEGLTADSDSYNLLVKGFCNSGQVDKAWKTLQEMMNKGYPTDLLTCGNLVERFCGAKRVNEACLIFEELENRGFTVGMLAYNAMLRAIMSSGDLESGFKFSGKAVQGGCLPKILAYKTILDCLIRTGRTREASDVVAEMIKTSIPDVTTYTALISVLCKHNRSDDAMRVFQMMVEREFAPPPEVYTSLLQAHCRNRRLEGAYKIFVEMMDRECPPSLSSYGLFLRCLCNGGKFYVAYDIHRSMVTKGILLPDELTYTSLVAAACSIGQTDRARQLFEEATGCLPASFSSPEESSLHNALVEGLCKTNKVDEAFDFIATMVERGWVPTLQTYNALIVGFFRVSQPSRASELFAAMKERGYIPNAGIYSTLVTGLCKAGKVDEARDAFHEAVANGTVPDNVSYNALIRGLFSVGKEEQANELYRYMSDCGYTSDRSTRNLFELNLSN